MGIDNENLLDILQFINPTLLNYQEWINVGMALKDEGYTASVWDDWSKSDSARYHSGECFKKWGTFQGNPTPVTVGTIIQYAKDQGWHPQHSIESYELDWDAVIGAKDDDLVVVKKGWIEGQEINEPKDWEPVSQLVKYLETLFESTENVGYVTTSWYDDKKEKYLPTKGNWDRSAGELIQALNKCNGDIGSVLGDYSPEVGAWIRFNPLDGKGIKNENVTDFRYSLVESDTTEVEQQYAILKELELPIACLVHSGKRSLHAIVKIEAANYDEYRKRVDYLYTVCEKNGLKIDTQNRNPSRLSRMPGVMRGERKQFLVDTNIGKSNWKEWQEWIEGINDDLPEPENLTSVWENLPELSPPLINGILRQGHKMLLVGPSKAGKSYALIELCCAIAEGKQWLGWQCTKGKIMYVNLELDRPSCLHRFKDVYTALGWEANNISNIDIWNLRGKSVPMDKLAPKLIRRATKKNYIAIIIDPIYKVITGDENSADQMAHFCNQFDLVCHELGAAVIYCHHHSKGMQGQKRSMDRASGSGVFARDPDALIDMIDLELTDSLIKQEENKAVCKVCKSWLKKYYSGWESKVSQDDSCSDKAMLEACRGMLQPDMYESLLIAIKPVRETIQRRTAWRIEGTLREFPKFKPVNIWYDFPIHRVDKCNVLKDADAEGQKVPWQRNFSKKKSPDDRKEERKKSFETAFEVCGFEGKVTVKALSEYLGKSEDTVRRYAKEHGGYWIDNGEVGEK